MNTKEAIDFLNIDIKLFLIKDDFFEQLGIPEKKKVADRSIKGVIKLLQNGKKYKDLIVKQSLKIKELEEAIKIQDNLIKEYMAMLNKIEGPGLLMDAVGRKLLFDAIEKENKPNILIQKSDIKIKPYLKTAMEKVFKKYKKPIEDDIKKLYGVKEGK